MKAALIPLLISFCPLLSLADSTGTSLELRYTPFDTDRAGETVLWVTTTGDIQLKTCMPNRCGNAANCGPCLPKGLGELTPAEIEHLRALIDEAKQGAVVKEENASFCHLQPVGRIHYTADDSRVFLRGGTYPCGLDSRNTSRGAEELVKFLNDRLLEATNLSSR